METVMEYLYQDKRVMLIKAEQGLSWFVVQGYPPNDKWIRCLGCADGLDLFDACVSSIRALSIIQ
jgi:hypothetical protein